MGVSALSFIEYEPGLFGLEQMGVTSDEQLLELINRGAIGGSAMGVNIGSIFGGTEPATVEYNQDTGANNIRGAKITKWLYLLKEDKQEQLMLLDFEGKLDDHIKEYSSD